MTRGLLRTALTLLLCSISLPALGQQYYLYEPTPVTPEERGRNKEGVLVREVPVRKGDSLYRISRRFSGRGMYYPQILLFNDLKNPNLIFPGDTLRVPVKAGDEISMESPEPAAATGTSKPSKPGKKSGGSVKKKSSAPGKTETGTLSSTSRKDVREGATAAPAKGTEVVRVTEAPPVTPVIKTEDASAPQKMFERALKAYRQDDCRTALELFDRYLAAYPGTALEADANLYKAECYLKLSSQ